MSTNIMEHSAAPAIIPPRTSSQLTRHARKTSKTSQRTIPEDVWLASTDHASPKLSPERTERQREKQPWHGLGRSASSATAGSSRIAASIATAELPSARMWSSDKEKILFAPYDYLIGHPGKDIRTQLITAFDAWLNVPVKSLQVITEVVGMLHTASLLIDDVEDSSKLRRGVPVAHSIFGAPQTINSANYVYFCALQELQKLGNPTAIHVYTEELLNLHRGQGMDLFWRDTLTCPTEEDYLEMVGNKTGGLFRLAIKLMQAESSNTIDYVPLVNLIGLNFQILDDYKNLFDTTYTKNKGLCEDLTEGKFSFPVIHSIRSDPQNRVLINILKQKTTDEDVKRYAVRYMEDTGSFVHTRQVLRDLNQQAVDLVNELERNCPPEFASPASAAGIRAILQKLRVEQPRPTSMET